MEKISIFLGKNDKTHYQISFSDAKSVWYRDIPYTVAKRIKELRIQHNFSQTQIANILNINQKQYWRLEQANYQQPIEKIITLAYLYNVSVDYLLGIIDSPIKIDKSITFQVGNLQIQEQENISEETHTFPKRSILPAGIE